MRFYARPSWRMAWQIASDLFVVAWCVSWWLVGRSADGVIRGLAGPARRSEQAASDLQRQVGEAAGQAGRVPVVGSDLRQPFDEIARTLADLATSASTLAGQLERVGTWAGWLVFLIPALSMVAFWLPRRIAFATRARETLALLATGEGDHLLALRALAHRPLAQLRTVASDPVAGWRSGDPVVVERLMALELAAAGVAPPTVRGPDAAATLSG